MGVQAVDVDAFLTDVKALTPQVKSGVKNFKYAAPADDTFLEEMGNE
ncbi:hypothetical protein [Nostoc sp.]